MGVRGATNFKKNAVPPCRGAKTRAIQHSKPERPINPPSLPPMIKLTTHQKNDLMQRYAEPMRAAKEKLGHTAGGCGFTAADAIVLTETKAIKAYDAAVALLHMGMHTDITNSRRSSFRGRQLLALSTEVKLNGREKEVELWFDISAADLEPAPECIPANEDDHCCNLADVVSNGSLGELLFAMDDVANRDLTRPRRYNMYSSDQDELTLMYAAIDSGDTEIIGLLLTRTSLNIETCDEECLSLVHLAYANQWKALIELLHKHGLDEDYNPKKDPGYLYYADEEEEEEDEEEGDDA